MPITNPFQSTESVNFLPYDPEDPPYDDGEPLETNRHRIAMNALIDSTKQVFKTRQYTDFFVGGNMFIHYPDANTNKPTFRGPDFFAVLNIDGSYSREDWRVAKENGRYPDIIIELTSKTTAKEDKGPKKDIYEQTFQTAEYFIFDVYNSASLEGWRLKNNRYQPIDPNPYGWLWSETLSLWLGIWYGDIDHEPPQGECEWLRFYDKQERVILLPEEYERQQKEQQIHEKYQQVREKEAALHQAFLERKRKEWAMREAELERQRAEKTQLQVELECQQKELAQMKAEQERQRSEKLAEQLRALGIDPNEIK
jgi:Uma2 family endonuclease